MKVINTKTKITRTTTLELSNDLLLNGVKDRLSLGEGEKIVSLTIGIPLGGDYSGMDVEPSSLTLTAVTETVTVSSMSVEDTDLTITDITETVTVSSVSVEDTV